MEFIVSTLNFKFTFSVLTSDSILNYIRLSNNTLSSQFDRISNTEQMGATVLSLKTFSVAYSTLFWYLVETINLVQKSVFCCLSSIT